MADQDPALNWIVEAILISLFKLNVTLAAANPCHGDEDTEATSPRLVVKASGIGPFVTNGNNPAKRLEKVGVEVSLHANRAKMSDAEAMNVFNSVLFMVQNMGDYTGQLAEAVQPVAAFFLMDTEDGSREREESSRIYTRKFTIIAQKRI